METTLTPTFAEAHGKHSFSVDSASNRKESGRDIGHFWYNVLTHNRAGPCAFSECRGTTTDGIDQARRVSTWQYRR